MVGSLFPGFRSKLFAPAGTALTSRCHNKCRESEPTHRGHLGAANQGGYARRRHNGLALNIIRKLIEGPVIDRPGIDGRSVRESADCKVRRDPVEICTAAS